MSMSQNKVRGKCEKKKDRVTNGAKSKSSINGPRVSQQFHLARESELNVGMKLSELKDVE